MAEDQNESVHRKCRIFLADPDSVMRENLISMVQELGHEIAGQTDNCHDTIRDCKPSRPDIILSAVDFPDGDGIDTLVQIAEVNPLPAIIITTNDSLRRVERAMDDHVMAYLVEPVSIEDLKPTIHLVIRRFEQFESLHEEVKDLRQSLETRKILERAKGILMAKESVSEEEAYYRIRNQASRERRKIAEVANEIIDSEENGQ